MTGIFSPHPNPALRVLSLGAGVQSTTMLLMAAQGAFGPAPDLALFADTQAEWKSTYANLRRLRSLNSIPFEILNISKGSLRKAILESRNSTGQRFASVPFYTLSDGGEKGQGRRQCTKEYKLEPLWAEIRSRLGVAKGHRVPKGIVVETWIGITTDEVMRASASRHKWEHKRYPLIEAGMSRGDCIEWLKRINYPVPVKSRCFCCPYTHNAEWRRIKSEDPEQWDEAVSLDKAIRTGGKSRGMRGHQFVHRSCVPLDQADLAEPDPRQLVMGELCEGMCGV